MADDVPRLGNDGGEHGRARLIEGPHSGADFILGFSKHQGRKIVDVAKLSGGVWYVKFLANVVDRIDPSAREAALAFLFHRNLFQVRHHGRRAQIIGLARKTPS